MCFEKKVCFGIISTKTWDDTPISKIIVLKLSQNEFKLAYHMPTSAINLQIKTCFSVLKVFQKFCKQ